MNKPLSDYFGGRRGWLLLVVALLGGAAFFNWGWPAAVGVAPVLLALAPCAAMCALGLCVNGMAGRSCGTASKKAVEDIRQWKALPKRSRVA